MARRLVARALQAAIVVFLVATAVFFLVRLAPGDPVATAMDNPLLTPEVRERWREAYGLDRSLPEQYVAHVAAVARGDFGWSFSMQRPVSEVLRAAIPNTLVLMGIALALGFGAGVAVATVQARSPGSLIDRALSAVSLVVYSIPEFWLALMLLLVFALSLGILPAGGSVDPVTYDFMSGPARALDRLRHLILPALTLALTGAAAVARYQRAALLDVLPRDFVRTARAKGASERRVLSVHALRNALAPTISLFGLSLPALLGGAVFVEKIFSWPGMGLLAANAVGSRDYPVVVAVVVVAGVMVAVGSLVADLLLALADPRVAR